MKKSVLLIVTGIVFLVVNQKISAQEEDFFWDIDVQVASTQSENIFNAPSSVSVIDKEMIGQYNFSSVAEAIQTISGMAVTRTYLKRQLPTSRGILQDHYANKVLVLVNGIPLWNAVTGEGDIDRININDIERIEVLKGPASVLYGTNAYSGAINLVLKNSGEDHAQAHMGIGANGSFNAGGNVFATHKDFSLFASANSKAEFQPNGIWKDESGEESMLQENLQSKDFTFIAKYKSHSISLNGLQGQESYLGVTPNFAKGANHDQMIKGYFANYSFNGNISDKLGLVAGITYDWGARNLSRSRDDIVRANVVGNKLNALVKFNYDISDEFSFELGADYDKRNSKEYKNYDVEKDTLIADNNMKDRSVSEYSAFGQLKFMKGNISALLGGRYTNNDLFGGNFAPRATFVYSLNDHNSLKLIYGESFRAPSLFELYFQTSSQTVFGKTDLLPEKSKSIELAYVASFDNLFVQAIVYHGIYENKIYRSKDTTLLLPDGTPNVGGKSVYTNGENFTANGIELELKYSNPEIIDAFVNVNYIIGGDEDKDENGNYNFKYVPASSLALGIGKMFAKTFNISTVVNYWSEVDGPFEKIGSQYMIDLNLSYSHNIGKIKFTHTISAKNLTDNDIILPEYVRRKTLNSVPWGFSRYISYMLKVNF